MTDFKTVTFKNEQHQNVSKEGSNLTFLMLLRFLSKPQDICLLQGCCMLIISTMTVPRTSIPHHITIKKSMSYV